MSIPVVTVGQTREDLVGGLERLHGPVTVVRRCAELPELLAACQSGLARAAVVADGSEALTASLVDRLGAVGVAIIALTDSAEEAGRLRKIGVASALTGVQSAELSDRIADAVEQLTGAPARAAAMSSLADTGAALHPVAAEPEPDPGGPGPGRIIAVWGPAGSPGRTTLAANMAAELAADGEQVLLIDADSYGASVAAVLGLLDESAALAQACRLADQGALDADALRRLAVPVATTAGTFTVLTGITRADRWTELRAPALALVLERARQIADVVVVDTGFCLEADEELSFDTMAPRRNGATLRALEVADTVFAVGAADPVGVPRLVKGLAELENAVPQASPMVVMNKVRSSSVGRGPERQLRDAWERYGPASELQAFLPYDIAAADAALLAGSLLLESSPESALRRSIRQLVCAPVQQKAKSSVFSSTAGRRAKD
ncbi:MinD-like ATPase involved in chromosome partitioning or flagellar assembly [Pseudarthrobacter equi]|uniref:MinD-like ATPase involved in chromosome partitioning or flagellar assembly n=1 Tax=Pseudarthrobacter equi TaxID=728066 RepID=A0A1H2ABL8_9MICC|nr:P-loop NTPase [Pseudarthrobacter equi]SDT43277.1 MinD-like ATPase involved in chromosome partitioning or flagellar assembly [Pseudarthrobacter equi]